jgi:hypothetical protein
MGGGEGRGSLSLPAHQHKHTRDSHSPVVKRIKNVFCFKLSPSWTYLGWFFCHLTANIWASSQSPFVVESSQMCDA